MGLDLKSGPSQDQPGSDGIGDVPYNFQGGSDRFPLMKEIVWVNAPLRDDAGLLIMTTRDYSNFADIDYFARWNVNHPGVDLALSPDGTRIGSWATASTARHPVYVHAICDGQVEKVHPIWGYNTLFIQIHQYCGGGNLVAYYGHISPKPGITSVQKDDIIGTVMRSHPITHSHLHLTLDTQTQSNLTRINYEMCDYELDAPTQTVMSLSNCVPSSWDRKPTINKMLLRIGWSSVTTVRYANGIGEIGCKSLYISEPAMKQLGFISFFDLY